MSIEQYKILITNFIAGKISVDEFQNRFLISFKTEPGGMKKCYYRILDKLFGAVDSFWHECLSGDESAFEISEDELRRIAQKSLEELNLCTSAES